MPTLSFSAATRFGLVDKTAANAPAKIIAKTAVFEGVIVSCPFGF
jgi:hypothetical protein